MMMKRCTATSDKKHIWHSRAWFEINLNNTPIVKIGPDGFKCEACKALVAEIPKVKRRSKQNEK